MVKYHLFDDYRHLGRSCSGAAPVYGGYKEKEKAMITKEKKTAVINE